MVETDKSRAKIMVKNTPNTLSSKPLTGTPSPIGVRPAGIAPAAIPSRGIVIGTCGTYGNAATTEIIRISSANQ